VGNRPLVGFKVQPTAGWLDRAIFCLLGNCIL
jgi:hypothetical protein